MFEQFTYRARRSIVLAQEEARSFRHGHLGTEHLLLGLLRLQEGLAGTVLGDLGVTIDPARSQVITHVGPNKQLLPSAGEGEGGHVPFTTRAKEGLELALQQRTHFGGGDIDTAHLLLGILRPHGAVAAEVLIALNANANPALANASLQHYTATRQRRNGEVKECSENPVRLEMGKRTW